MHSRNDDERKPKSRSNVKLPSSPDLTDAEPIRAHFFSEVPMWSWQGQAPKL